MNRANLPHPGPPSATESTPEHTDRTSADRDESTTWPRVAVAHGIVMAVYGLNPGSARRVMSSRAQFVGVSDDDMAQGVVDAITTLFSDMSLRQRATAALDQIGIDPAA